VNLFKNVGTNVFLLNLLSEKLQLEYAKIIYCIRLFMNFESLVMGHIQQVATQALIRYFRFLPSESLMFCEII